MTKERFQNPTINDEINLRLFSFNSNAPRDFESIEKVEIYILDPTAIDEENPDGRTLVDTIESANIDQTNTGEYKITITLEEDKYVIGSYLDVWYVVMEGTQSTTVTNMWKVLPRLWFTTPSPLAYDFNFDFRPNKIRKGSKRYLVINVTPNVPTAPDLEQYYAALVVTAPLKIYIEQVCGECMPTEADLRLVVDGDEVAYRERNDAFYQIDTTDYDEGIYDVWFELELGDSIYVSDRNQLQITH
jgi:hypothetical protein